MIIYVHIYIYMCRNSHSHIETLSWMKWVCKSRIWFLMFRDLKLMVSWVPTHFEAAIAKARWAPPCCWKMASWKWRSRKRSVTPNSKSEWWLAKPQVVGWAHMAGDSGNLGHGQNNGLAYINPNPKHPGIRRFMMVQEKQYNIWIGGLQHFWHLECLRCAVASWRHARVWTFQRCRLTALR